MLGHLKLGEASQTIFEELDRMEIAEQGRQENIQGIELRFEQKSATTDVEGFIDQTEGKRKGSSRQRKPAEAGSRPFLEMVHRRQTDESCDRQILLCPVTSDADFVFGGGIRRTKYEST